MNKKDYQKYAKQRAKKSKTPTNCLKAFFVGGTVCCFGQLLLELFRLLTGNEDKAKMLVPVTLIFISAILTGLGVFDKLAKHAGAGTLVPITGFANAVASPALDAKSEGFVMGVGANIFKIAGPVIVYGTIASVIYGVVYWITTLF